MIEILRATPELVEQWYGEPPAYTMKGYVIKEGQEIIAICGIFWCKGRKYIFSEMKDEMQKYKKAILKAARKVLHDVGDAAVYAVATEGIESSERFIKHFGFECIDPVNKLYRRG